jgi:hypothetical protein
MRRQKYYYNTHSLQFEKYKRSPKAIILRSFAIFSAIIVTAGMFYFIADTYFPSQKEKALMREIEQMKYQYLTVVDQVGIMTKDLQNIQKRDAGVHRFMFGMDPIDNAVWNGGIGGHDKYANLIQYEQTGELLVTTQQKVDLLERQIQLQLKSLDTLESYALEREDMFHSIPSIKPVRIDLLKRNVNMLSGYGVRFHPVHKVRKMHYGIDFTAPTGTAIQATGKGKVIKVKRSKAGYGRHVIIDHGYGYETLYAHMQDIVVKEGDSITKGQKIGSVGSTGTSTAPHCHYESRLNGQHLDPVAYCMDGLTPEEYNVLVERASITNQSFD